MPNKSRRASAPSGPQSKGSNNAASNAATNSNSNQRKWSQQHNADNNSHEKLASSSQNGHHSNGGGQRPRPLRTRREAEATTNGHNGVHDEVLGDEDCGRLI